MPQLPSDPYLDTFLNRFITAQANKYAWRISGYDVDDLIQEGLFCYCKCKARYVGNKNTNYRMVPEVPDAEARKHFMALVKVTILNRFNSLSKNYPTNVEVLATDLANRSASSWNYANNTEAKASARHGLRASIDIKYYMSDSVWDALIPVEDESATMVTLMTQAPKEIKQLLSLLVSDAVDGYRRIGKRRRKPRETSNNYFCRKLGLPYGRDIMGEFQRYFFAS